MKEYKLLIPDMSCQHCVKRIKGAVEDAGGNVEDVNLDTKTVFVKTALDEEALLALIDDAGYGASIVE
jgi:copper chaperone